MRKANVFVNAAMKLRLGGEEVVSILEACRAVDDARQELLQEVAALAEARLQIYIGKRERNDPLADDTCTDWERVTSCMEAMEWLIAELRRLAQQPVSGGAND